MPPTRALVVVSAATSPVTARGGRKPVVILYAEKPDMEMIGQSILQGAADVIIKPFDSEILHFKLKQAGVI